MENKSILQPDKNGFHSINLFVRNNAFWIIEGTWFMLKGIHGPFLDINDVLNWVLKTYIWVYSNDGAPIDLTYELFYANEIYEGISADEISSLKLSRFHPYNDLKFMNISSINISTDKVANEKSVDETSTIDLIQDEKPKNIFIAIDRRPETLERNFSSLKRLFAEQDIPFVMMSVPLEEYPENILSFDMSSEFKKEFNTKIPAKDARKETLVDIFKEQFKCFLDIANFIFICNK